MNKIKIAGIIVLMAALGYLYFGATTNNQPREPEVEHISMQFVVEGSGGNAEVSLWTDTGFTVDATVTPLWIKHALASSGQITVKGDGVSCKILDSNGNVLDKAGPKNIARCDYSTN